MLSSIVSGLPTESVWTKGEYCFPYTFPPGSYPLHPYWPEHKEPLPPYIFHISAQSITLSNYFKMLAGRLSNQVTLLFFPNRLLAHAAVAQQSAEIERHAF